MSEPLPDTSPTAAPAGREITGVILAGGRSRRMGADKAFLALGGEPVLAQLVRRLAPLCSGGVTVVRREDQDLPDLPEGTRVEVDLVADHGALGGLYTGLTLARTPAIFLAACDMPLLSAKLVAWLRDLPSNADVIVPVRNQRLEPLHALYGTGCLAPIKAALDAGELRMDAWFGSLQVERVEERRWRQQHPSGHSLLNVNRAEDFEVVVAAAAGLLAQDPG